MVDQGSTSWVVAVTRAGLGDWFRFSSFEEADRHPLIQYGDVICVDEDHIMRQWTRLELPDLLRTLGDEDFRSEVLIREREAGGRNVIQHYIPSIWKRMVAMTELPPTDPAVICETISRDRELTLKERRTMTNTPANTAPAADKAPEAPALVAGFKRDAKITLLTDKDGKPYGKDHNPKRAGTKSAERFAVYKNGMTVDQALEGGLTSPDIKNDVEKKFIKVG
jgi:hypothetical protein